MRCCWLPMAFQQSYTAQWHSLFVLVSSCASVFSFFQFRLTVGYFFAWWLFALFLLVNCIAWNKQTNNQSNNPTPIHDAFATFSNACFTDRWRSFLRRRKIPPSELCEDPKQASSYKSMRTFTATREWRSPVVETLFLATCLNFGYFYGFFCLFFPLRQLYRKSEIFTINCMPSRKKLKSNMNENNFTRKFAII